MKFTREQFDELGPFYVDEFPIDDKDQDFMFHIFNSLSQVIQGQVVMWGFSDTEVREKIFEHLCEKVYKMSIEQYYESEYSKVYFEEGIIVYPNPEILG
jgi:hypothetical protein